MVALLPAFADAEQVALALLQPLTTAETVTATPPEIVPPLIQVQRVGGGDDGLTDFASLEVACFGTDRGNAWQLAEVVRQYILAARHEGVVLPDGLSWVVIDDSVTTTPPDQVPWTDPQQRVVAATYELQMRRPFTVP